MPAILLPLHSSDLPGAGDAPPAVSGWRAGRAVRRAQLAPAGWLLGGVTHHFTAHRTVAGMLPFEGFQASCSMPPRTLHHSLCWRVATHQLWAVLCKESRRHPHGSRLLTCTRVQWGRAVLCVTSIQTLGSDGSTSMPPSWVGRRCGHPWCCPQAVPPSAVVLV